MKVIKISAIWCSACLITNKSFNKLKEKYNFEYEELDLDMDQEEVVKYNVGENLPLFIVLDNDKEITRFSKEFNYEELKEELTKVGVINEKDS